MTNLIDPSQTQSIMNALGSAVKYGVHNVLPSGVGNFWNNSFQLDGNEWDSANGIKAQAANILSPVNNVLAQWQATHGGANAMPNPAPGQANNSPAHSIAAQMQMAQNQSQLYNQLYNQRNAQLDRYIQPMMGYAWGATQMTPQNAQAQQHGAMPSGGGTMAQTGVTAGSRPNLYPVIGHAFGPGGSGGPVGMGWSTSPDASGTGGGTQFGGNIQANNMPGFGTSQLPSRQRQQQQQQPGGVS